MANELRVGLPCLDEVLDRLVRRVRGHEDPLRLAHQLGERGGVEKAVAAAERVRRPHHAEPDRHHRVLVAGFADQLRHRRGPTGADDVVDGEGAARDVVLLHDAHRSAARLVVAAARAVGDDHQQVAGVLPPGYPAGRAGEPQRHQEHRHEAHRPLHVAPESGSHFAHCAGARLRCRASVVHEVGPGASSVRPTATDSAAHGWRGGSCGFSSRPRPGYGHVLPMVPLARALLAAGHEVLWATSADACPRVAAAGIETAPAGSPRSSWPRCAARSPSARRVCGRSRLPRSSSRGCSARPGPRDAARPAAVAQQWIPTWSCTRTASSPRRWSPS